MQILCILNRYSSFSFCVFYIYCVRTLTSFYFVAVQTGLWYTQYTVYLYFWRGIERLDFRKRKTQYLIDNSNIMFLILDKWVFVFRNSLFALK